MRRQGNDLPEEDNFCLARVVVCFIVIVVEISMLSQGWSFTPWFFFAFLVSICRPCRSSQRGHGISRSSELEARAVAQGNDEDDSAVVEVLPWAAQNIVDTSDDSGNEVLVAQTSSDSANVHQQQDAHINKPRRLVKLRNKEKCCLGRRAMHCSDQISEKL